jgi:hypothetical protein
MKKILLGLIFLLTVMVMAKAQTDAKLFPGIDGWKNPDSLSTYTSDNLWDIINGAADGYLLYDFEEMTMGDYTKPDGQYITLEVYRHQTPEDAFGIFSQERPSKANYIDLGGQGYQEEANLNFFAGRYYIKIRCSGKSDADAKSVRNLGESIVNLINPASKIPSQVAIFPVEGKVLNSEQYINDNFMGYSFFKNAFVANYLVKGSTFNIFIISNTSPELSKSMLESLLKNNGKTQGNFQQGIFDIKDKYNGNMKILWKGKYLCGIYNTADNQIMQDYIALLDSNLK